MVRVPFFLFTESPGPLGGPLLTPAPAAPVFDFPSENPRSFDGLQGNTPAPASPFSGMLKLAPCILGFLKLLLKMPLGLGSAPSLSTLMLTDIKGKHGQAISWLAIPEKLPAVWTQCVGVHPPSLSPLIPVILLLSSSHLLLFVSNVLSTSCRFRAWHFAEKSFPLFIFLSLLIFFKSIYVFIFMRTYVHHTHVVPARAVRHCQTLRQWL